MDNPTELTSTQDFLVATLAREFITLPVGERLPTTAEYARRFGVGFGSIQAALGQLKDQKIIRLRARGAKGTYLVAKEYVGLWQMSNLGAITGLLPLPFSPEIVGLATGIREAFRTLGIPCHLTYLGAGARPRVAAVLQRRAHFTVLSLNAAEQAIAESKGQLRVAHVMAPGTYYSEGSLIVLTGPEGRLEGPARIGIDSSSVDHERLSRLEFSHGTFVPVQYSQIPHLINSGEIDMAVWHQSSPAPVHVSSSLRMEPLQSPESVRLFHAVSPAAVVVPADSAEVAEVFAGAMNWAAVEAVQRAVLQGKRVPEF